MNEKGFNPESLQDSARERYEQRLWSRADELASIRVGLQERLDELFEIISSGAVEGLGLYREQQLTLKQLESTRIREKLNVLELTEAQVQKLLLGLENGSVSAEEVERFLGPSQNQQKTSKRKQRIQEEREKLGIDPREIMFDSYGSFRVFGEGDYSKDTQHLTTGRHARKIKNLPQGTQAGEAENAFYHATTDTHGAKVKKHKRNDYLTQGGKRIRKS
ncbi:MAG: hypothetical protein Q8P83_01805 [bacterium]|nr:hypothetical protein [bacterium]